MVWVRERLGAERVSERRVCRVLGQARSTQRRDRHIPDDEARLVVEMVRLATQYGRYGYRRITAMLRWEGWKVNHKRVERLWRQEGLKVPSRQPKRRRLWLNDGSGPLRSSGEAPWARRRGSPPPGCRQAGEGITDGN